MQVSAKHGEIGTCHKLSLYQIRIKWIHSLAPASFNIKNVSQPFSVQGRGKHFGWKTI